MSLKSSLIILISSAILVGCSSSQKASEVQSKYIPSSRYSSLSCDELIKESELLRARSPALAKAVDKHRKNQTGIEVVTWVLFWPAAFMLNDGSDTSDEYAEVKGSLEAIQQNLMTKKCGS